MINPYFCYAFTFSVALITYLFGWSDLYPALSISVCFFLIFTILVFTTLGVVTLKSKIITFKSIEVNSLIHPFAVTLFIYFLWSIEFIHAGGIPLFKILLKQSYDYRIFGVPTLHVFVVTFSSFYTICLFHLFLSNRSRIIFLLYFLNLISAILIYNRGMLFFNLSASVFLYLIYKNRVSLTQIIVGSLSVIILFFIFGVLGSLRVSREGKKPYTNEDFLVIGKASGSFRNSIVPEEFFWSYIYISSPLANLQHNINTYPVPEITSGRVCEFVNNEIMMDFISKRVNSFFILEPINDNRIPGPFNVSTIYSRPFSYLGWCGILIMAFILTAIPWGYSKILSVQSPFFLTGIAILCTMYLFLAFDNTIRFTGLCFQLIYPVVFHFAVPKNSFDKKFSVHNKVTRP